MAIGEIAAAEKEKNFVSAVVYLKNCEKQAAPFLEMLDRELDGAFQKYEIICVNDASVDDTAGEVRAFGKRSGGVVSLIQMSIPQGEELCMNAGLDLAIGDFVFECDSVTAGYPAALILEAYRKCLTGYDVVALAPKKNRGGFSNLFYRVFNRYSQTPYALQTEAMRVVSRRAINRVRSISPISPYRKAAYAGSGLKLAALTYDTVPGAASADKDYRTDLAVDSLILYTNAAYKISLFIALFMLLFIVGVAVYVLAVYFGGGHPVPGWTTTMLLTAGGFFGVFLILTIIIKYLSVLVNLIFKKQKYLLDSIEKITK